MKRIFSVLLLGLPAGQSAVAEPVEEGPYVDGKRHGEWVVRHDDGTIEEGPYFEGERHGQ